MLFLYTGLDSFLNYNFFLGYLYLNLHLQSSPEGQQILEKISPYVTLNDI